jgi:hypothetical protein
MSHATLEILKESRKLRDEIRMRREKLKHDLAQSQKVVAAIIAATNSSIAAAKQRK